MAKTKQQYPSQCLQAMTQFLTDMMDTTLLSLPKDIKGLIYFDALAHLASEILVSLPVSLGSCQYTSPYHISILPCTFQILVLSRVPTHFCINQSLYHGLITCIIQEVSAFPLFFCSNQI